MKEEVLKVIKELRSNEHLNSLDEAATKQAVILKILSILGWDPFNVSEVYPEYSVGKRRVDYALRYNNRNKVFIEVKKVGEDLERHQKQLLDYSFREGVKLAILTNGITWWFYLPLNEGSWEQRKFYTIEIYDQDENEIAQKLTDLLSKENVISGKAIENAKAIYTSRQKQSLLKETIPQAWNKLLKEPDKGLIELLAEKTEKLCGYKPDHSTVKKFLNTHIKTGTPTPTDYKMVESFTLKKEKHMANSRTEKLINKTERIPKPTTYTGKKIRSFTFKGEEYVVNSWKEMLLKICEIMHEYHHHEFRKVLNLIGSKRPYFTTNPKELRDPTQIDKTDIYVETNLSANAAVKLSKEIINLFGYKEDDLIISLSKKRKRINPITYTITSLSKKRKRRKPIL